MSPENGIILGIGDYGATCRVGSYIKTYALGSCVALIILDRNTRCVGMAHIALPDSSVSAEKAKEKPGHFADTAVKAVFEAMRTAAGSLSQSTGLIVKLTGGANVADLSNTFEIGKRNVMAIKKTLWKYNLAPRSEDVGGSFSRTVTLYRDTGKVEVSSPGRENWFV